MALRMWRHYLLGNVVHIYTDTQKLEVHLHSTGPEREVTKMTRVDQRLRVGSSLSLEEDKCHRGRVESQGLLQLLADCTLNWRRV
jgi:hypothetical protein